MVTVTLKRGCTVVVQGLGVLPGVLFSTTLAHRGLVRGTGSTLQYSRTRWPLGLVALTAHVRHAPLPPSSGVGCVVLTVNTMLCML